MATTSATAAAHVAFAAVSLGPRSCSEHSTCCASFSSHVGSPFLRGSRTREILVSAEKPHLNTRLRGGFGLRRRGYGKVLPMFAAQSSVTTAKPDVQLGKMFEGVEVLTTAGEPVPVLDLWRDRRVVVGWARHFGCLLCKKRAAMMVERKKELDAAGVTLVIIGPGNKDQAKAFKEQTSFAGEVYADPTFATFKKLGFVSGAGSIFNPKALASLVGASLEGFKQDWGLSFQKETVTKGGWQQGGVLVAGPGVDNCYFLHKDAQAGDEPEWSEVVQAAVQQ